MCAANANLIAAAPDMLVALRAVSGAAGQLDPQATDWKTMAVRLARAAIAKAEAR